MTNSQPSIDRPIFVIGAQRGGTTMFYRRLSTHPDLAAFTNLTARFPRSPLLARAYALVRHSQKVSEANEIWRWGIERDEERRSAADANPRVVAYLHQVVRTLCRSSAKPRFVNKSPSNSLRVDFLDAAFPDARFIHILRDGRPAAVSGYLAVTGGRIRPVRLSAEDLARQLSPLELAGLSWQRCVETARSKLAELPPERWLEIRYEDMLDDPQRQFRRALELLGLPFDEGMVEQMSAGIRNSADKWRSQIDAEQRRALEAVIGPTMQALGYPLD